MKRLVAIAYGAACYGIFLVTLLYAIGFLGNFGVPKTIDSGSEGSLATALLVDAALLALFAVQQSVMARPWFKRAWTRIVPPPVERSTLCVVLQPCTAADVLALAAVLGGEVWNLRGTAGEPLLYAVYATGLLIVLVSTFLINYFDLFGLRQVWLYLTGQPYSHLRFRTPLFYR